MATRLVLHVGHGKTGSSFLQSVLALNQEKLAGAGIHYPAHASFDRAVAGEITSGNGQLLHDPSFVLHDDRTTLLSGELLFTTIASEEKIRELVLSRTDEVAVIIYTRDVLELLVSAWGQSVKRSGVVASLSEHLQRSNERFWARTLEWIDTCDRLGLDLVLRNYSRHKADLAEVFLGDIGLGPHGTVHYALPPKSKVNRSLSAAESVIQRFVNGVVGGPTAFISNDLVNKLPDVVAYEPKIDRDLYDSLMARYQPTVDALNEFMDPDEKLEFGASDIFVGDGEDQCSLTSAQLDVVVQAASKHLPGLRVERDQADILRDIALKIEDNAPLSLQDALALMSLAQQLRPGGRLIARKVAQWSDVLEQPSPAV